MPRFLLRVNITQKFLLFLVLISIIPMLVGGIASIQVARDILRDRATGYLSELVNNQKDYLDLELKQGEDLVTNISGVETIIDALDNQAPSAESFNTLTTQAQIGYILSGYSSLNGLISIDLFALNGTHYHVGDTLDVSSIRTDLQNQFYAEARSANRRVTWLGIEKNVNLNSGYQQVITAAAVLTRTDLNTLEIRPVGLLLINFDPAYLYDHFLNVHLGQGAYMMVIDSKNRVIYHPEKRLMAARISSEFAQKLSGVSGSFTDSGSGTDALVTYRRSALSGWTVLCFMPLATLTSGITAIGQTTLLVMGLAFLLVGLASVLVNTKVVSPVREITRRFRMLQEGTLDEVQHLPATNSQDETGDLVRWFNTFLDGMRAHQQAETALRESQERYSLALQGANDGIWDWDLRANTLHYSARWKEMLGYSGDEIGQDLSEWFNRVHPEDLDRLQIAIAAHLEGRSPNLEVEHRMLTSSGAYRWFLARGLAVGQPQQPDDGEQPAAIRPHRMAGSLTDITSSKEIEERLTFDAMHDPMTHLFNRVYFILQLQHAIELARRREGYQAAVLFMDLDRFKIVNDSLGHEAGDQMLIGIAQRLMTCLRSVDTIARFSGDEFVILLDGMRETSEVIEVTNRLQEIVAAPFKLLGQDLFITASIGIALITADYHRPEEVLRDADTAMYRAKANGRAGYELFGYEMHEHNLAVLRLESDMRHAIERQEFRLHYQPILSLETNQVSSVEALIRWQHPERGMISPDVFIGLAEDTGMIVPIGEWVLRTACADIKALRQNGFPDLTVSINISARQVQSLDLPELIQSILREMEVDPLSLRLEITETSAMSNLPQTLKTFEGIRAMGIGLSIDDFGTYYSALSYLKRFPIDTIKIDRSFIQDCATNADDAAITAAMVAMAHILELKVVAEGVEDTDQLDFLRRQQCDMIQGYLLSRPVPVEELMVVLESTMVE